MKLKYNKYLWFAIVGILFILAFTIRFYQLNNPDHGFYLDEAAIGYNAYSILKTGKDEFGKSFPLLFRSFTDFKAPLYIYLTVLPIKILGLGIFSTRFISAFSGSIAVICIYFLLKLITKNNRLLSFLTALVLTIAPWHVFYSRGAWESNLSFLLLLGATLFCVYGFTTKRRLFFLLGSIFFVLSTYAYHGQRIVAPLIFGFYLFYYRKWLSEKKKFLVFGFLVLGLLTIPILAVSLTPGGQSRVKSLSIFSPQTILPWKNQEGQSNNRTLTILRKWFALYTAYYSPRNLFSPDPAEKQRWLPDLATFYIWQLPFYLLGLIWLITKKKYERLRSIIWPWFFFSPLAASLTGDPFSTVRALPLVFPLSVIIAIGIYESIIFVKSRNLKIAFSGILVLLIICSLINLMVQLFYILPFERAKYWELGYSQLGKSLSFFPNQNIVIDNSRGESYIHVLFFTKFDPATYQKEAGYLELPNYYYSYNRVNNKKFGQFEYRSIDWGKEEKEGNIVVGDELISSRENILNNPHRQLFGEILYPDKTVAFRIIKAGLPFY
ncbi:hypothetical protein COS54_03360 [Candidatus Shapirobacteria bacterium CG03_land_8_20_14_0_80_39_12]|uniref:Glycosyltransferase RgtA/B/C/D-like domain-containing protein n=1 Tax=Candidatus Shapirobacteria bacterium CG03_land_8_20_14_0_80_39_12 TaxID=1974879 RepID=A0A2M7BAW8_9BACT|nr:MAG: hypothetical protein COS54_03360 [Candidatus Shapirobacteria bacterium CG03_land_8_20_14_0_80_39_12]